jgi:hypothetical protein
MGRWLRWRRYRSSDPPIWRGTRPTDCRLASGFIPCTPKMLRECCPLGTGIKQLASSARR